LRKIKIQFIGTFTSYFEVALDAMEQEYFESIANRLKLSLVDALIDPYFYYVLRLDKYQSYQNLKGKCLFGLDVNSFHQIEIFVDGYKKQKFTYFDLNPQNVLFPLYPSDKSTVDKPLSNMVIRTKEKGRVTYSIQDEFPIVLEELISFKLIQLDNNLLINNVIAKQVPLSISKSDTLIIEQFVDDYRCIIRS
jgi:hypothetical protein